MCQTCRSRCLVSESARYALSLGQVALTPLPSPLRAGLDDSPI